MYEQLQVGRMASLGLIDYGLMLSVSRIDQSSRKVTVGGVSRVFVEVVTIEWAGCRVWK